MKQKILFILCLGLMILPMYLYGVTIKSVDFISVEERSRLKVGLDSKADYDVTRKDDKVVLTVKDAKIPDNLARPYITKEFVSAIEEIIPVQSGKDVVFNIKMKQTVPYLVSQNQGIIFMDFDVPAELKEAAEKAAQQPEHVVVIKEVEKPKTTEKIKDDNTEISISESGNTKKYTGKRISIDFQNADIHNALRVIADVSGLNMVTSDDVKGTVTIKLKDVPWDQAFDVILESKDLDKMQMGNIVRIAPANKIKEAQERQLASMKVGEQLEPLITSVMTVNFANASEIAKIIKGKEVGIVSERGSITAEDRTNVLIVKDIKNNVEAVRDMIRALDKATPQVLIEARIVQADDDWVKSLGVQWGGSAQYEKKRSYYGLSGLPTTSTPSSIISSPTSFTSGMLTPEMVANYAQGSPSGMGLTYGRLGETLAQLDFRIDIGETTGDTNVIAKPRVITMDNKKATIRQGEKYPYLVRNQEGELSTELKDIELVLEVTPRVASDGSVNMEISVKRNAIGSYENYLGDPSIASREVQTEVLVRDGETTVIGGIIEEEIKKNVSRMPKLGQIPVLGMLFRGKTDENHKKELLIFITPKVIKPASVE
jgi:type IV pilus assembly protein PilQ